MTWLRTWQEKQQASITHTDTILRGIDIIVLEGIYLFKRAYRDYFDLALWVESTFETALERALRRNQEGLPPGETTRAYQTIYFPAQDIHFSRDHPRTSADFVINNDPRLPR